MWLPLSIMTAVLVSIADAMSKKLLQTHRSEAVAFIRPAWASLFLISALPWAIPPVQQSHFWIPVAMGIPLEIIAALAFNHAMKIAPMSLVIPYMAFTPVFLILGGWLLLGEHISLMGGFGIGCVALGAVFLQAPVLEAEYSFHWKRFFPHEEGPLLIMLVAFLYAITSVLAKKAINASSPLYFCGMYFPLIAIGLLPFQFRQGEKLTSLVNRPGFFLLIGGFDAVTLVAQFIAFQLAPAAYVVAIKRMSLLITMAWGWIFFQEQKSVTRLGGAVLMAVGAGLIALR